MDDNLNLPPIADFDQRIDVRMHRLVAMLAGLAAAVLLACAVAFNI